MSISSVGTTFSPVSSSLASSSGLPVKKPTAEDIFLEYAKATPQERLFNAMLGQLGISPDAFKAMSPAEQQKVMQKIQEMIQRQVQKGATQSAGLLTDKSA